MSKFAAVFGAAPSTGAGGGAPAETALQAMLGTPVERVSRTVLAGRAGGIALAVPAGGVGAQNLLGCGAARDDDAVCVADAALYHREDLVAALRRALGPRGALATSADLNDSSDAVLILLAYRAWGVAAPSHLEGDFAFAIWDDGAGIGLAAADFAAGRTLFHGAMAGALWVASSLEALSSHPDFDKRLNLAHFGEVAGGFWAGSSDTHFLSAFRLLPGHSLIWEPEGWRIGRHWSLRRPSPRSITETEHLPFAEAAAELRERLVLAVGERMSRSAPAVWLSGGYDSTAVFAAGQEWLRRSGLPSTDLPPISMSYPEGDPGREDDLIRAVTSHWGVSPTWVKSDDVPVLGELEHSAASRDEPWAHPFEGWNRALAAAAKNSGAATVLTGNGGDQLFASPIGQISDLFWRGKWRALRREWSERRGKGVGLFTRVTVLPGLPRGAYRVASVLRGGRRIRHFLDRFPPPWFRESFLREHDLLERQWNERVWARPGRVGEAEMGFYFGTAYAPRVSAAVRGFLNDAELEVAAPLLDARVVSLAVGRPGEERSLGVESKRLLRQAMRGLLPESVLAPRAEKTGLTVGYFERRLRRDLRPALTRLGGGSMRLADLGIVEPGRFRQAVERYLNSRDPAPGLPIYLTLQAEIWLRARPQL
jgi:asparagine synthase (glutamine-hydrolysing)